MLMMSRDPVKIELTQPTPLREVVALCLDKWGVTSDDESDTSDEFCGWHVGSRAHPGPRGERVARTPPSKFSDCCVQ